jgi:hypothetical protein
MADAESTKVDAKLITARRCLENVFQYFVVITAPQVATMFASNVVFAPSRRERSRCCPKEFCAS